MPTLRVAIIGCGTAGPAAGALLARAGHDVTIFERAPALGPVGAGILLQPSGMNVLHRLGVLPRVLAAGARITHLRGVNTHGRRILDLRYADLRDDLFGLGVQRGLLFTALLDAARAAGVRVRTGVEAVRIERESSDRPVVVDVNALRHGPFDLILVADGARSVLRTAAGVARRDRVYPFGAAWFVARDPTLEFAGVLSQVYDGTSTMLGLLPTGRLDGGGEVQGAHPSHVPTVSLFWSLRMSDADALRAAGAAAFRRRIVALAPHAHPVAAQIESTDQILFACYHDVVCRTPIAGRVVFLGDAAHAMSPQLGQGANLALVDAMVLADSLAHDGHVDRALAAYARRRRAAIRYYTLASRWLTPVFQSGHDWLAPLRDALFGPMCRVPLAKGQMLRALAGIKSGFLTSTRLPDFDIFRAR